MAYVDVNNELSGIAAVRFSLPKNFFKTAKTLVKVKADVIEPSVLTKPFRGETMTAYSKRVGVPMIPGESSVVYWGRIRAKLLAQAVVKPVTMPRRPVPITEADRRIIQPPYTPAVAPDIMPRYKGFRAKGIAPRVIYDMRGPSGSTYKSTDVKVVRGADIVSARITGAGAPMTGQDISLRETDPIIPVTATAKGIRIADEAVPTFVEAAMIEPSPWMKYALLAVGGYILYDSFVKSRPKKRRRRR